MKCDMGPTTLRTAFNVSGCKCQVGKRMPKNRLETFVLQKM